MFGDKLQLAGGPRYDWFSSRVDNNLPATPVPGKTNSGNTWTYNYGALIKPTRDFSLFYGHSETYNPNFGAQPDGTAYPSQTGLVDEVGIKMAFAQGRITGTLSTYNLKQDHILLPDPDPTRATAGYKVDSGKNTTKGDEADVFFQLTRNLTFSVGGATMKYTTTTHNIAPRGAPSTTANSTARYGFKDGALKGLSFGGGFVYKSKFNVETVTATQLVARYYLPAYHTFDAWTSYRWKMYTLQLNVGNVGNTWYLQRSTSKDQIWEGAERVVKVRVSRVF
jgi:iron complex outermembrane receptor protein